MTTRTCPYCGESSPANLDFCPSCGRRAPGAAAAAGEPDRAAARAGGLYTNVAMQALDLSDTFAAVFLHALPGWRVEMARPSMSTAGGRQALQHIALRRQEGDGGSLVIGSVDTAARRAELRAYRRVDAMFRERHDRPLPISMPDWNVFSERAAQFLREEGFRVTIEARPRAMRSEDDAGSRGVPVWAIALVVVIALAAVGVAGWWVLRPQPAPVYWPVPVPPPGWTAPLAAPP